MQVEEFGALFELFQRSAFRVKAPDRYDVDTEREEFAAFLEGKPLPPRTIESDRWLALGAAGKTSGRLIERVRIVSQPLNDYIRYEFAAYRDNIAAGETIGVIPRGALADSDQTWASKDFWIFDNEQVVLLSYDDGGRFLGVQQSARHHSIA
ncbi:MAG: hypothetical protein JO240_09410 [Solirubrobacterales bacterium]|nr:hypothetical protein [Solirubrobacterales bacterium]